MNEAIELLKNLNISKDNYVVLACSGGPDSMFLLNMLVSEGYKVVVAHVNHKVRTESDDEYKFLKEYATNINAIFEGIELTTYTNGNFEKYAREFRYDFFEKLLKKYNTEYLFTAHHGDDLVETVMMRLVRGSSLKGYKGFTSITNKKDYKIIRPLLYLTKDFIEEYNKEKDIPYVIDNSNLKDEYTRNRFRHHLLPFLKEEDPYVHERFIHFSHVMDDVDNYIDRVVNRYLKELFKDNILDISSFKEIDSYIQNKIVFNILEILYPDNLYLVNNNHIVEILKIINSSKPNIDINIPGGFRVVKEYNKVVFTLNEKKEDEYDYIFDKELEINDFIFKVVEKEDSNSNYVIRLSSKDISFPLHIRSRKVGDKMKVKNLNGSKKINDIFIDLKISKEKRNTWPLLVDSNNEILLIPGLKKSKFDTQNNNECDIIITCVKKERHYE